MKRWGRASLGVLAVVLLAGVEMPGCAYTEAQAEWYGFWGFVLLILAWGAADLWHRLRR